MPRNTLQREAIREVFLRQDRPLQVAEVLDLGRKLAPSLDQATVYRNLKRLVEEGWLLRISSPHLGTVFERSGKGHHHHFYCRVCERLLELDGCAMKPLDACAPKGFHTEGHEVYLHGVCKDCGGAKALLQPRRGLREMGP
ncbi:MAG TPA: transcriptional repressor [Candidatus Brocadiia bacterium]|nr:transcriptional repressor [Candidatus Brocadiia bacterium]